MLVLFYLFALTFAQESGNNGTTTQTCDATPNTTYKYIIHKTDSNKQGFVVVYTLNVENASPKYVYCSSTHYKVIESGKADRYVAVDSSTLYYAAELPNHVAYSSYYSDNNCATEVKGSLVLMTSDCHYPNGDKSYIYSLSGTTVSQKIHTGETCSNTFPEENSMTCGSCFVSGVKPVCSKYGENPSGGNTTATPGYKINENVADNWRNWEWNEQCTEGCIVATNGAYKFEGKNFLGTSGDNWPSNTILAQPGHKIEITFDVTGKSNFYLKGGKAENKVTYSFIMPENGIEYGIYFEENDGALNDVSIKFIKSTTEKAQTKMYMNCGKNHVNGDPVYYTNPINYVIQYGDNEVVSDFTKYKYPIWQTTDKFTMKFNNLQIQGDAELTTNLGYHKDVTNKPTLTQEGLTFTVTALENGQDWLHEIKVKKVSAQPGGNNGTTTEPCDANYGKNFKYLVDGSDQSNIQYLVAYVLNTADASPKYTVCNATHYKKVTVNETTYEPIVAEKVYYAETLPAHIAYSPYYKGKQCTEEIKGGLHLLLTCVKTGLGMSYGYKIEGSQVVQSTYSNNDCSGEGTTANHPCGQCSFFGINAVCNEYGKAPSGGNSGTTTPACKENFGTNYKYIINKKEKQSLSLIVAYELNVVIEATKYSACNDTHYKKEETGREAKYEPLEKDMIYYSDKLPAHVAYGTVYGDNKCGTEIKGQLLLAQNDCIKEADGKTSSRYSIDGNKIISNSYTSADCTGSAEPTRTECDKCLETHKMKYKCHEYGKPNGAMSTLILLAIAFIFFMF